jgi:hypothetical protein
MVWIPNLVADEYFRSPALSLVPQEEERKTSTMKHCLLFSKMEPLGSAALSKQESSWEKALAQPVAVPA